MCFMNILIFQGPFTTFKLPQDKECDWTGLKFSPDGKMILISTNGNVIRLIDAFQGTPLQAFMVCVNSYSNEHYNQMHNCGYTLKKKNIKTELQKLSKNVCCKSVFFRGYLIFCVFPG